MPILILYSTVVLRNDQIRDFLYKVQMVVKISTPGCVHLSGKLKDGQVFFDQTLPSYLLCVNVK